MFDVIATPGDCSEMFFVGDNVDAAGQELVRVTYVTCHAPRALGGGRGGAVLSARAAARAAACATRAAVRAAACTDVTAPAAPRPGATTTTVHRMAHDDGTRVVPPAPGTARGRRRSTSSSPAATTRTSVRSSRTTSPRTRRPAAATRQSSRSAATASGRSSTRIRTSCTTATASRTA